MTGYRHMNKLQALVDRNLEVIFRSTYPDMESVRLGRGKKIQLLVRHTTDSDRTKAVLGSDVEACLEGFLIEKEQ